MIIDSKTVDLGDNISFRSINGKDNKIIQGYVVAICDYQVAKLYSDVIKYHQEVLESNPTSNITEDATVLNYFVIKDIQNRTNAYAVDWVEATTLTIIAVNNDINLTVFDVAQSELETILKLLRDNGYNALETV